MTTSFAPNVGAGVSVEELAAQMSAPLPPSIERTCKERSAVQEDARFSGSAPKTVPPRAGAGLSKEDALAAQLQVASLDEL